MNKKRQIIFLVFLIVLLFAVNYSFIDKAVEGFLLDSVKVRRVIDGDTIVVGNDSVRLLGINSPERGEDYYEEAKKFLEELVLNESVRLEFIGDKYDKYGRLLAYVYFDGKNINVKLVEEGFANYYFYSGKDKYSNDLLDAWDTCIKKNVNLCKKSEDVCASCISINLKSIINNCNFDCDISNWQIKGEGRKEFIFSEQNLKPNEEAGFELDLTDSGGSLFLRDGEGGLVLWRKD